MSHSRNLSRIARAGIVTVPTAQKARDLPIYNGVYPENLFLLGIDNENDTKGGLFYLVRGPAGSLVDDGLNTLLPTGTNGSLAYRRVFTLETEFNKQTFDQMVLARLDPTDSSMIQVYTASNDTPSWNNWLQLAFSVNAAEIDAVFKNPAPVAYVPTRDDVKGHLVGIDNAIQGLNGEKIDSAYNPDSYTPVDGSSIRDNLEGINNRFKNLDAEKIPGAYTPGSYAPVGGSSVRDHLEGINNKFRDLRAEQVEGDYSPSAYSPVGGTSVRDHLEGINNAFEEPVEGVIFVSPNGDDQNSGVNHRAAVATLNKAVEIAETLNGRKMIYVYPHPTGYELEPGASVALPDNTTLCGMGSMRNQPIKPTSDPNMNAVLVGAGCYVTNFSFEGFKIDDLTNPTVGFGVAFRPGATITRLPYVFNCVAYRDNHPGLVPPPTDRDNGNPLVGNGGGCMLADGAVCSQYSFPQMMAWGFTPSVPNGIGYCVKNGGFINGISAISVWARVQMMALSGGRIQASSCATHMGDFAFWSAGSTDVVDPEKTTGPLAVNNTLADEIAKDAVKTQILDLMWDDLIATYPVDFAGPDDEKFSKGDGGLFLLAMEYCLRSGTAESIENFTRGLFDYKGDYVFDIAKLNGFKRTFEFMATELKKLTNDNVTEAMIDGLVTAINATLDNPIKRPEPSYINAVQHQFNLPGAGVTYAALPRVFGYQGQSRFMEDCVYTDGVGRVDWSASDDNGSTRWVGGARIDGLTGELGGPPVDAYVRRQIESGLVAAFGV